MIFSHRTFTALFLSGIVIGVSLFVLGLLVALDQSDTSIRKNFAIQQYQFEKLEDVTSVETIIVGDSSAGHAVNAELFSDLLESNTVNLALTASFGFAGDYNMIRQVVERAPSLKNVIIVHSFTIWDRPFSAEGYRNTLGSLSTDHVASFINRGQSFNFVQSQVSKNLFISRIPTGNVIFENDFFKQKARRFSRGTYFIPKDAMISNAIHPEKIAMFRELDRLCGEHELNCIYLHGPILEYLAIQSLLEIISINNTISSAAEHIRFVDLIFTYPDEKMGEATDHIDPAYKDESTRNYASVIDPMLE